MKVYKDVRRQKQANTIKGSGNPNWKGGQITKQCTRCGSPFLVYPSRKDTQTHCSLTCANRDIADAQKGVLNSSKGHKGKLNKSWKGGDINYKCPVCNKEFIAKRGNKRECCSRSCSAKLQLIKNPNHLSNGNHFESGENNPNWHGGVTQKNLIPRGLFKYKEWRTAVFKRDNFRCRICGKETHNVVAHHIKPFAEYPELRFEIDNGITLCIPCHKQQHK